jgi:polyhydroxyalkanoate synthase subunit PhaC
VNARRNGADAPRAAAAPAVAARPVEADDAAAPLDLLLVDGALGPMRRLLPGSAGMRLTADLARRPGTVARRGFELAGELGQIVAGQSRRAPSKRDHRCGDDAWSSNPVLRRFVQAYLAAAASAEALLSDAELDWRDRERLTFAADNLIAALSPSNNPLISPVAWKALIDSGGGNVLAGLRNLLADLATAPRMPTMVRPDAFEVGADLALTPGAVVLRTDVFELIQYTPQTPTVRTRPLLVIPAGHQQVLHRRPGTGSQPGGVPGAGWPAGLHDLLAQSRSSARRLGPRHVRPGDP